MTESMSDMPAGGLMSSELTGPLRATPPLPMVLPGESGALSKLKRLMPRLGGRETSPPAVVMRGESVRRGGDSGGTAKRPVVREGKGSRTGLRSSEEIVSCRKGSIGCL